MISGGQQHHDHEIAELIQQHAPQRTVFALPDCIGSVSGLAFPYFFAGQALTQIDLQPLGYLKGCEVAPLALGCKDSGGSYPYIILSRCNCQSGPWRIHSGGSVVS